MPTRTLRDFAAVLAPAEVVNDAPVDVRELAYDTRAVRPGALFFCLRGSHDDGHALAPFGGASCAFADVAVEMTLITTSPPRADAPPARTVTSRPAAATARSMIQW